jgi:hypothetical protein
MTSEFHRLRAASDKGHNARLARHGLRHAHREETPMERSSRLVGKDHEDMQASPTRHAHMGRGGRTAQSEADLTLEGAHGKQR